MAVTSVSTIAARSIHEVDPFSVEVVRQGLASIAEEMTLIVMRAARSPVLREAGDLSSAITDARGGIIAQGRDLPVHLGVMAFTVKALIKHVGQQNIRYGDVWIVNHPEVGGNHLPDVKVIRPIFHGSQLIAFGISLAHWADVGGGTPGSYNAGATDAWQEGLLNSAGSVDAAERGRPEIMSFIKANVRGDSEREGDILAQVACCMLADKRVNELVDRLGLETFLGAVVRIHEVSEQQVRRILSSIPDGSYHGEDFIDGDGRGGPPVKIAVDIKIKGDQAVFDFSDSGDSILAPLNTTALVCQTSVIYVLKSISKEEVFHSDGCFRPIEVITRRGSIIDPLPGYPLAAGNHETSQRIVDAVIRALSTAIPERICAGGCGTAGLLIFSGRDPRGQWWTFYETHGGGEGAHMERDGYDATRVHLSNMANTPSEVVEAEYPIQVLRYAIRDGSGGKGKHQGGKGLVREYKVLSDRVTLTTIFERGVIPPYGLFGGENGAPFKVTLQRGTERIPLSGCQNVTVGRGDIVLIETAGGGGFGSLARVN